MANKIDIGSFFNQSQEGGKADIALNLAQQSLSISKVVQSQISQVVSNISNYQTIIETNDDTIKTSFFELQTSFENLKGSVEIISNDVDSMSKVFFKMNKEDLQKVRDEAKETFELEDKKQKERKKKKKKKGTNEASDEKFEKELKDKVGLTQGGLAAAVVGAGSIKGWADRGMYNLSNWFEDKLSGDKESRNENMKSVSNFFNQKASGGPVTGGETYLVGERGPELFQPSESGNIVSSEKVFGRSNSLSGTNGNILQPNTDWSFVKNMVKTHEGLRTDVYNDSKGFPTVGYGHKIDAESPKDIKLLKVGDKITKKRADQLFEEDWDYHLYWAKKVPGWSNASKQQKAAIIDLTFNMGPFWYEQFPSMVEAMKTGNWKEASLQLEYANPHVDNPVKSDWFGDVGLRRNQPILSLIENKGIDFNKSVDLQPFKKDFNQFITPITEVEKSDQKQALLQDITSSPELISQVLDAIEIPGTNTSSVQNSGQTNDSPPPTVPHTTSISGTGCDIDCVNMLKGNSAYNMSIT